MPTYNFGAFIAETLESILPQLPADAEVVVLDGGSTDTTEEIMRRFTAQHAAVRYVRQPERGGIDRDMARSIELARGEYCWLFSSDDVMRPGVVARLLEEMRSGHDIYLGGFTLCTKAMRPLGEHPIHAAAAGSVFDLRREDERRRYFAGALTTPAFFSFMGSILVRRSRFLSQPLEEAYVGSCWAHVVRILRLVPDGLTVKLVGESLLLKRSDNDSFMERGLVHRYAIAIDGYHRIAAEVFGSQSFEARYMRRVVAKEYPAKAFLLAKLWCLQSSRREELAEVDRLAAKTYGDPTPANFVNRALYRLLPVSVYARARAWRDARRSAQQP